MGKRGRSRSNKPRTPSGQLSRAGQGRDYGNIRVVARHTRFMHFIDDKGLVHEGTSAGRLWIVGALEGLSIDGQVLRDHLLGYGRAYWGEWPTSSSTANYLQENRRGHDGGIINPETGLVYDSAGAWFKALDRALLDAGRAARTAVVNVAVDPHFFPDYDVDWVDRIINGRVKAKREAMKDPPASLYVCGQLPVDSDFAMLECLRQGAMALAEGKSQKWAA